MSDCLAGWCADDRWCAVTCTAEVVGRKWSPVVVERLLAEDAMGFAALEEAIPDVSSTVLSDTLEHLEERGVVERRVLDDRPFRVEYALTERGRALEPVVDAMAEWGREWDGATP